MHHVTPRVFACVSVWLWRALTDEIDRRLLLAHADEKIIRLDVLSKVEDKRTATRQIRRSISHHAHSMRFTTGLARACLPVCPYSMNEVLGVQVFDARDELIREHQNSLEREFTIAKLQHQPDRPHHAQRTGEGRDSNQLASRWCVHAHVSFRLLSQARVDVR
jgi:hypothetical protein